MKAKVTVESSLPSTGTAVRSYVARYPSLNECLRRGLANHSAIARAIKGEYPAYRITALIAAVRRFALQRKGKEGADTNLDRVFQRSRITAQGGIALVICRRLRDFKLIAELKQRANAQEEVFLFMEGTVNFTIVASRTFLPEVKKIAGSRVIATYQDLSLLSVSLPYSSVHTAGVSARLTGLLAGEGIAMLQEMTSAEEYFIVLATRDLTRAIDVLEHRRSC